MACSASSNDVPLEHVVAAGGSRAIRLGSRFHLLHSFSLFGSLNRQGRHRRAPSMCHFRKICFSKVLCDLNGRGKVLGVFPFPEASSMRPMNHPDYAHRPRPGAQHGALAAARLDQRPFPPSLLESAFLQSLSVAALRALSDADADHMFIANRWAGGRILCPKCSAGEPYAYRSRGIWKCRQCGRQFSATSGTYFARCKMPYRNYLLALAYAHQPGSISASTLSRELGVDFKSAHRLLLAITTVSAQNGGTLPAQP